MIYRHILTALIVFILSIALVSCAQKNKKAKEETETKKIEQKTTLEVHHFLLKADKDAEALLTEWVADFPEAEIVSVSKFPANVAFSVIPGAYIPKFETKYPMISTFTGKGVLKDGLVLPVELIKWRKATKRGRVPTHDEKGSGISLRFEASEGKEGKLTVCTSLWYSEINGEIWGSESATLLAADPKYPKVLWNLPTEMKKGETTLFVVTEKKKKLTALIALMAK